MGTIDWAERLEEAKAKSKEEQKLLFSYIFSPG